MSSKRDKWVDHYHSEESWDGSAAPKKKRKTLPAPLVGFLIAAVLFLIGMAVFQALGFGDDPVVGAVASFVS